MEEILTPEVIDMFVTGVAGGFSAYHGIKIGLFVLGKVIERRKAKKQAEEQEQNTRERRRLGRILEVVSGVVGALNKDAPKADEPTEQPTTDEPDGDPAEAVDLEEIVKKVIDSIAKNK